MAQPPQPWPYSCCPCPPYQVIKPSLLILTEKQETFPLSTHSQRESALPETTHGFVCIPHKILKSLFYWLFDCFPLGYLCLFVRLDTLPVAKSGSVFRGPLPVVKSDSKFWSPQSTSTLLQQTKWSVTRRTTDSHGHFPNTQVKPNLSSFL